MKNKIETEQNKLDTSSDSMYEGGGEDKAAAAAERLKAEQDKAVSKTTFG